MQRFEVLINYLSVSELTMAGMVLLILFLLRQNHKANIFLSLFILSISIPLAVMLTFSASKPAGKIVFLFSVAATSISGSFIYTYIRFITGEIEAVSGKDLLHFLPFPLFLTALFLHRFSESGPHTFSPFIAVMGTLSLVIPTCYIIFSFLKIRRYAARVENWFSDTERMSISWLHKITVLGLVMFVLWDAGVAAQIFHYFRHSPYFPLLHLTLIATICLMTTYHVIRQPDIFTASRDMKALDDDRKESGAAKEKYAKQSIDPVMQKEYLDRLLAHMTGEKPFLDEGVTIRSLSEELGIPIHHLSIVINTMLNRNFSTFINEYRVREALSMLEKGGEDANILSIAFASGFSSKSSFNSAFKKITGKTPSEYKVPKSA